MPGKRGGVPVVGGGGPRSWGVVVVGDGSSMTMTTIGPIRLTVALGLIKRRTPVSLFVFHSQLSISADKLACSRVSVSVEHVQSA